MCYFRLQDDENDEENTVFAFKTYAKSIFVDVLRTMNCIRYYVSCFTLVKRLVSCAR